MKWLIRTSLALNFIVVSFIIGLWFFGNDLVSSYLLEPTKARWRSQFDELPIGGSDIVFLGDSITEGGSWEELFQGLPVRNRGIAGDVTTGVLARLDQITNGRPKKIFLLIGTNDLASQIEVAEIAGNVGRIVDSIRISSPGTQIYVQSVLPRSAGYRRDIERLNQLIESRISGKADWINLYPLFLDGSDGSIRDDLSNDELHLLGKGYLVWRDAISSLARQ